MEEGRAIFDNIRKYLAFLLSANIGELLIMLAAGLFGYPLPLVPVQILYVNLATDGLPALALGIGPPMQDLMRRRPRDPKLSIFAGLKGWIVGIALLLSIAMTSLFVYGLMSRGVAEARSLVFASIIVFELAFAFSCRSQNQTIFRLGVASNKYLVAAVLSRGCPRVSEREGVRPEGVRPVSLLGMGMILTGLYLTNRSGASS